MNSKRKTRLLLATFAFMLVISYPVVLLPVLVPINIGFNNGRAWLFAQQLNRLKLPEGTELVSVTSEVFNYGNGNWCMFIARAELASDSTIEELEAHFATNKQTFRGAFFSRGFFEKVYRIDHLKLLSLADSGLDMNRYEYHIYESGHRGYFDLRCS